MEKNLIILGIGSNLGKRWDNIEKAIAELKSTLKIPITISPIYETAPWEFQSDHLFLNCCISFYSSISAFDLLEETQKIEKSIGRTKKTVLGNYQSRYIDIDLLYLGKEIIHTDELKIPHPLIKDRNFVLVPLKDLHPNFIDPIYKRTILQMLEVCTDTNKVYLYKKRE